MHPSQAAFLPPPVPGVSAPDRNIVSRDKRDYLASLVGSEAYRMLPLISRCCSDLFPRVSGELQACVMRALQTRLLYIHTAWRWYNQYSNQVIY
jgi:hypothetical protein